MTNVYESLQFQGMIPEGEVDFTPRNVFDTMFRLGYVPAIGAKDAAKTAKAMLKGHCNIAEIAMADKTAAKAIAAIKKEVPEMTVGAAVKDAAEAKEAIEAGADYILCTEAGLCGIDAGTVPVIPTCKTVDDVRSAHANGFGFVNYVWQDGVCNISKLMELASMEPVDIKFIVSLGSDTANIGVCESAQFVQCVRGSWLGDAAAEDEDRIVATCEKLLTEVLGYAMWHIGINTEGHQAAKELGDQIHEMFRLPLRDNGISSRFAGTGIEVMKKMYLGANGHFAMRTNKADRAILLLKEQGYDMDWETKFPAHGPVMTIYMKDVSLGGFAVHLLQRAFPDA